MDGYQLVAAVHEALGATGSNPRERLERAAEHFWNALAHSETWPPPLRRRAAAISARLFRRGSLAATLPTLSDSDLKEILGRLESFADDFLRGTWVGD